MSKFILEIDLHNDKYCDDCYLRNGFDECAIVGKLEENNENETWVYYSRHSKCPLKPIVDKSCETCKYLFDDGAFTEGYAGCVHRQLRIFGAKYLSISKDFCCKYWESKE